MDLDREVTRPIYDIFGLHNQTDEFISIRVLHHLGNMPSFKDWHMRQILSFASKIVRTNNPESVAKYILDHIFYNDPNDNNIYPYDPALADFRLHKGWNIQFIPSTHRVNFFPANLRLLFKAIPQNIVNLFGTYAFDDLLTKYIKAKCPHQINSVSCIGCHNDNVLKKRLDHRINQQKFDYFYRELALAGEFCLAEDLDPDLPFEDFKCRIDTAFIESKHLFDDLLLTH